MYIAVRLHHDTTQQTSRRKVCLQKLPRAWFLLHLRLHRIPCKYRLRWPSVFSVYVSPLPRCHSPCRGIEANPDDFDRCADAICECCGRVWMVVPGRWKWFIIPILLYKINICKYLYIICIVCRDIRELVVCVCVWAMMCYDMMCMFKYDCMYGHACMWYVTHKYITLASIHMYIYTRGFVSVYCAGQLLLRWQFQVLCKWLLLYTSIQGVY